jgi:hypothetical protein
MSRSLEASHLDARRRAEHGLAPCYVVDYEQLHRYMYRPRDEPQGDVVELEYLFAQPGIWFVVGHGTRLELKRRLADLVGVGNEPPDASAFLDIRETRLLYTLTDAAIGYQSAALSRLRDLLGPSGCRERAARREDPSPLRFVRPPCALGNGRMILMRHHSGWTLSCQNGPVSCDPNLSSK